ncbi:arginine--tRNA ligase [Candidatus Gracilibacteria bacterium]|nr:arginine--tRNA ligase [Candidatus Gracilibacteria bacterium]
MQQLINIITSHINSLYGDIGFIPTLSAPPKVEHGEYCFGVFTLAKPTGKNPAIIAEEVASVLRGDTTNFKSVNTIGGYVNITCTSSIWSNIITNVTNPEMVKPGSGETIVVDYIGANAGKPLHIGHICTPSVGQSICNIYSHLGYRVIGDSHFGDWGGIFGKLIWGWKYLDLSKIITAKWADKYQFLDSPRSDRNILLNKLIKAEGVDLLLRLYQQFIIVESNDGDLEKREMEARLEFQYLSGVGINLSNPEEFRHHEENIELWKEFTSISISEVEKKLSLLNVFATYNIGESFYEGLSLPRPNNEDYPDLKWSMKDIVAELISKGVATQNEDGSVGVVFPEESKIPSCILQKKDGTGLYLTSDLAAIKYRLNNGWNPSKIIYSVDVRQQLHLKQTFTIAKMAWPEQLANVELFHAFNGFIKLKEGAMSTRHGTVIFLEDLITEGKERTANVLAEKGRTGENALREEDITAITVGAIKYSYLSQDREKDVTFDWDKALSFEGNSGPYIQYACVRAKKVANSVNNITKFDISNIDLSEHDTALIRTLAMMDEKILDTAKKYKPHTLALYCYDLAVCFNSFYVHTPKILEESNTNLKNLRLTLCALVGDKLTLGFDLLGIKMPSEM